MCSEPAVSVIMPAYNAAATIGDAVTSVINQSVTSWELIVVNDGSTDMTPSMALQAMRGAAARGIAPGRLRLVGHDINRGSAAAWQTGLEAARGTWVTKLDADDTLPPRALELLCGAAGDGADVVRGRHLRRRQGRRDTVAGPRREVTLLNDTPVTVDYFSLWGKIIRRSLLTAPGMEAFMGLDRWEDLGVVARVMALKPRTVTIDETVYTYNIMPRGTSLSTSSKSRLLSDHIAIARRLDEWFTGRGLEGENALFLDHLKFAAKVKYMRAPGRDLPAWKRTFPEVNKRLWRLRHVPLLYRLAFAVAARL